MFVSHGLEYETLNIFNPEDQMICVECFTYNQEAYLSDTLDGILAQKTDYGFFIIIIDDASTDGTREVINRYVNMYPDKIMAFLAKKNIFGKKDSKYVYNELIKTHLGNVKYIATCEGDDYWIDENKLRIQVNYMNNNPGCIMYLHNAWWLDCKTLEKRPADTFDVDEERDLEEKELIIMPNGHPATASRLYRRDLLDLPQYVLDCSVGDYPYALYARTKGTIHYSNRIMSVYRFKSNSSSTSLLNYNLGYLLYHHLGVLIFLINYDKDTRFKFHRWITVQERNMIHGACIRSDKKYSLKENWYNNKGEYYIREEFYLDIANQYQRQLFDEKYISKRILKYINKHKYIVVMGTGEYSRLLSKQLKNNDIDINGYACSEITDGQNSFNDRPLWKLTDIPLENGEYGVIVGILPKYDDGIIESLNSAGISDFIEPFVFEID